MTLITDICHSAQTRRLNGPEFLKAWPMTDRVTQAQEFAENLGWPSDQWKMVAGDASNRKYYRLTKGSETSILMDAPPEKGEDVTPFMQIARFLSGASLSAPKILGADLDMGFLLLEDLGDDLFATLLEADASQEMDMYRAAMDVLVHLHASKPPADLARYVAGTMADMAALSVEWYVNKGKSSDGQIQFSDQMAAVFRNLDSVSPVLIQRDYHAQNLLWLPQRTGVARVGLLDFQDAMLGHPGYDVVSILQDARRDVPLDVEDAMISYFCTQSNCDEDAFRTDYALLGLQRNLRILGVFARLSLRDGKAHYVDLIPRVWEFVQRNLKHPSTDGVRDVILDTLPPPSSAYLESLR